MTFEWDEIKRQKNLDKHRLDFRDVPFMFDGRDVVHVPAIKNDEPRFLSIAPIGEKFYTVVWTWRGGEPTDHIIQESTPCRGRGVSENIRKANWLC